MVVGSLAMSHVRTEKSYHSLLEPENKRACSAERMTGFEPATLTLAK